MRRLEPRALVRAALLGPAVVALGVYLPRVCRTVAAIGDSAELDTVAVVRGVAHAPGFPLYVLLAEALAVLPGLEPAFRLNVLSALLHVAAVGVTTAAVWVLTDSLVAATTGGLVLALARSFVLGSLYAEVFPLNDLALAVLLLLAILAWRRRGEARSRSSSPATRVIAGLALTTGLASAGQQIIILAGPALALLVGVPLVRAVAARPRRIALYLGLFLLPLGACYWTLWRNAASNPAASWGDVHRLGALLRLIVRADYWGYLARRAPEHPGGSGGLLGREALFTRLVWDSLGPIGCLYAALGLLSCVRRRHVEGIALGVAFLASGPLFAAATLALFSMSSPAMTGIAERFVTMPLVVLAILAGCAVDGAERWLRPPRLRRGSALAAGAAVGAAVVLPMVPGALSVDLSDDHRGRALAQDLVERTEDGALILVTGDLYVQASSYACDVMHTCGDRLFVAPGGLGLPWQRAELARTQPDIATELGDAPSIGKTHLLVEQEIRRRPVYVMPDFLVRDRRLGDYALVPDLLLVRLYPSQDAARAGLPAAHEQARALADGRGCAGCASYLANQGYEPREELLLRTAYAAALSNAAGAAVALFHDEPLAARLTAEANAMGRGGGSAQVVW